MTCITRGPQQGTIHVYLNGSLQCVCTHGPDRAKERMR